MVILNFQISQDARLVTVRWNSITDRPRFFLGICQLKFFENWSSFAKSVTKNETDCFLVHGVFLSFCVL